MSLKLLFPLGLLLLILSSGCNRQGVEFEIGASLAEVQQEPQNGFDPVIDDQFGGRFAFGATAPLNEDANHGSGLRIGGRLAGSFFREELSSRNVAGEPLLEVEDFANLALLTPQFVINYRQLFGDPRHGAAFFLEPGVGVGPTVGIHSFGADLEFADQTLSSDTFDTETEVSWSVNPYLRLGAAMDGIFVGAEGGYEWTGLEFDDFLGEHARLWYIGIFFSIDVGGS